ncbi:lectin MOA-related protein [Hyalangium gracile]|uniref:lectin MOA-related protein n=1 Tax=Hyalangium gracile TaxID=394092 RepID=UPI001CD01915|nr:lectin MOA-related protein [Hyalangium gracile]
MAYTVKCGDVIVVKSQQGKFLTVGRDGVTGANAPAITDHERFFIHDAQGAVTERELEYGESIMLFSQHGSYLLADPTGNVRGGSGNIGAWEKFKLINPEDPSCRTAIPYDGKIALQSDHGKYLAAEANGAARADRTAVGPAEKWTILKGRHVAENQLTLGDTLSLKSYHGLHLVAESTGELNANREGVGDWERFVVQSATGPSRVKQVHYGDVVSLVTAHGKYLGLDENGKPRADRTAIGVPTRWVVSNPSSPRSKAGVYYDDAIALRASNNSYLTAQPDGRTTTDQPNLGPWERWKLKSTRRYLTGGRVQQIIQQQLSGKFAGDFRMYVADGEYYCPSVSDAHEVIRKTLVEHNQYTREKFDCDDFAHILKAEFIKDGYNNGVRRAPHCFGIIWAGNHAFNWMINDDFNLRFIEPQSDGIFYPNEGVSSIYLMTC